MQPNSVPPSPDSHPNFRDPDRSWGQYVFPTAASVAIFFAAAADARRILTQPGAPFGPRGSVVDPMSTHHEGGSPKITDTKPEKDASLGKL